MSSDDLSAFAMIQSRLGQARDQFCTHMRTRFSEYASDPRVLAAYGNLALADDALGYLLRRI